LNIKFLIESITNDFFWIYIFFNLNWFDHPIFFSRMNVTVFRSIALKFKYTRLCESQVNLMLSMWIF